MLKLNLLKLLLLKLIPLKLNSLKLKVLKLNLLKLNVPRLHAHTHIQGLRSTCRRRLRCGLEQAGAKRSLGRPGKTYAYGLVGSEEELDEPPQNDQSKAKMIGVQQCRRRRTCGKLQPKRKAGEAEDTKGDTNLYTTGGAKTMQEG